MTRHIDLNSDLGEGFGPYRIADDATLLSIVSSANIACGEHAGDPLVMDATIREALKNNVSLGAHIGFPDRQGFGRRLIPFSQKELELFTITQLGALSAVAHYAGGRLTHVNFHGALGNLSFVDAEVAKILITAIKAFDPGLAFIGLPHTKASLEAEHQGLRLVCSFLADRAYTSEGILVARNLEGSVIKDHKQVSERVKRAVLEGEVESIDGKIIKMPVESILIHSDTAGAVELAQIIKKSVIDCGATIQSYMSSC